MGHFIGRMLATLVNLLTIDYDRRRGFDSDPDAIALQGHHGDANVAVNNDFFTRPTGQNQHVSPPCRQVKSFWAKKKPLSLSAKGAVIARSDCRGFHTLIRLLHLGVVLLLTKMRRCVKSIFRMIS